MDKSWITYDDLRRERGKSWIVYGPQGCGKTRNAKTIAKELGLRHIRDEWCGRRETFEACDTLHITNNLPRWAEKNRRVLTYAEAMKRVHG